MTEIKLETEAGEFVSNTYILPFQILPKVVLWGVRVFLLHSVGTEGYPEIVYREVFAVAGVDKV